LEGGQVNKQTVNVGGREVEWTVDGAGIFCAEMAGEKYRSETLRELAASLRSNANKTPLNIPFVKASQSWDDDCLGLRTGLITGRHSGNGNLLVKWDDDGSSEQARVPLLRGDVDKVQLVALWKAKEDATNAYDRFLGENKLRVPY
jgi:hypothetical protein